MIRLRRAPAGLAVAVADALPPLPPALEARVEGHWRDRLAQGARLFNGPLLSLAGREGGRLVARRTEYRRLVAQLAEPGLAAALGIRPLAVSGILAIRGGLVLGRRHRALLQDGGLWELVPAGGIEPGPPGALIDPVGEARRELAEEVGLDPSAVASETVAIAEDLAGGVVDIVVALRCGIDGAALGRAFRGRGTREYTEIAVVPPEGLARAAGDPAVAPLARRLLRHLARPAAATASAAPCV